MCAFTLSRFMKTFGGCTCGSDAIKRRNLRLCDWWGRMCACRFFVCAIAYFGHGSFCEHWAYTRSAQGSSISPLIIIHRTYRVSIARACVCLHSQRECAYLHKTTIINIWTNDERKYMKVNVYWVSEWVSECATAGPSCPHASHNNEQVTGGPHSRFYLNLKPFLGVCIHPMHMRSRTQRSKEPFKYFLFLHNSPQSQHRQTQTHILHGEHGKTTQKIPHTFLCTHLSHKQNITRKNTHIYTFEWILLAMHHNARRAHTRVHISSIRSRPGRRLVWCWSWCCR